MYIKIIAISLFALLVQHCFKLYTILDFWKHIYNHYPGPCHQVEGVDFGAENMQTLPNGITFITSGFRQIENSGGFDKFYFQNKIKGNVFLFNLKNPQKIAQKMNLTSTKDFDRDRFQPHGLSVWEDKKSGKLFLFVVNHEKDGQERVEKFLVSVQTLTLTHVKSYFGDPAFKVLNDVAATGEDSFYFTNFHSVRSSFGQTLEALAMMPWGNVGYFDGSDYRIVTDGLLVANGIHLSLDGKDIYVATSVGQELRIYDRREDNSLQLREIYPLYSKPDNVLVDPITGDLYLGLHPVGYQILAYVSDPSLRPPSQVLHVKLKDGAVSSVTELFMDDGNLIAGSTVATVFNKKMLIGSILDKLVYCDITIPL